MIRKELYGKCYTMLPLALFIADVSQSSIGYALNILGFDLNGTIEYELVICQEDIGVLLDSHLPKLRITKTTIEPLDSGAFYIVDHTNKKVVYSPGA